MIISTVSFKVAPGKNLEATEYFQQIARLIKVVAGSETRVLTQLGGPLGHVVLSNTFEDLNAWDKAREKITADPKFQKLTAEAAGYFIAGSVQSALYHQA
jgi:hypothetical protein